MSMKNNKNNTFILILAVFFTVCTITVSIPCSVFGKGDFIDCNRHNALIVKSQDIVAYNKVVKGFEDRCKDQKINIKSIIDLDGDAKRGKKLIKKFKNKYKNNDIDVVFTIGSLAVTLVKEQFKDIPIIFCMVINHDRFDLKRENITGIPAEASIDEQFRILKKLIGTQKNVGVIYDPAISKDIVLKARAITNEYGFNLVESEIESSKEAAPALNSIIDNIDALWLIPDNTVISTRSLKSILQITEKHQLPTVCTSSAIVKAGGFVSIAPDFNATGMQAANIAQQLLSNPEIMSLGIKEPDKLKVTLNTEIVGKVKADTGPILTRLDLILYP